MKKAPPNFIIICMLVCTWHTYAQSLKFDHLTLRDGLSQSTVHCIAQDHRGFMWLGTQDGLNRYDGYDLKVYGHRKDDPHSLSNDWILCIFEDSLGELWVGTAKGLNRYDRKHDRFIRYMSIPNVQRSIGGNIPRSITEDPMGNLWIGCWGGGLNRYDRQSDSFITYSHQPDDSASIRSDHIQRLYVDQEGRLWIGTQKGLDLFIPENDGFQRSYDPSHGLGDNIVYTLEEDSKGRLWAGTQQGLYYLDVGSDRFTPLSRQYAGDISDLLTTDNGTLWVATVHDGLWWKDTATDDLHQIRYDPMDTQGLLSDDIHCLAQDRTGILWIGGGKGVNICSKLKNQFGHFKVVDKLPNTLSDNLIWGFEEGDGGWLWIATQNGGLNAYHPDTGEFKHFMRPSDRRSDPSFSFITHLAKNEEGSLWVATVDAGLLLFNPEKETFKQLQQDFTDPNTKGINSLGALLLQDPYLWIGTLEHGLIRYDTEKEEFTRFTSEMDDSTTLSTNTVLYIFQDNEENLWVCGLGYGLSIKPAGSTSFKRIPYGGDSPQDLSNGVVTHIHQDREGTLWVGTQEGLNRLVGDPLSNDYCFEQLFKEDGLPSNAIYGILEDNTGRLWISTNKGIGRYHPKSRTFQNFTVESGLQSNEFNSKAVLRTQDGTFLFGGVNGFNLFHPDSIRTNSHPPPLVLTSFKVFDQEYPLPWAIESTDSITLDHDQNFFSFEYAALDYGSSAHNQYAYRMVGFDKDWVHANNRRYASYTNLYPGRYTFKVRAANSDGIWNETPLAVQITIIPPFWMTWWFRALVAVGLITSLITAYIYRVRQLKRQRDQKQAIIEVIADTQEQERKRVARDLHDSVGSMLTSLKHQLSHVLKQQHLPLLQRPVQLLEDTHKEVRRISYNMMPGALLRSGLGTGIQSLVARTGQSGHLKTQVHLFGLGQRLPPALETSVYRIVQELWQNVLNHSEAQRVDIHLTRHQDHLNILVEDDGKGFDIEQANEKGGRGMKNIAYRVAQLGGSIHYDSSPGHGTTVNISIPINIHKR